LKSRIEGSSRFHIKVLMRSTSRFSIFDFDMAISGPKSGSTRRHTQTPWRSTCTSFCENEAGCLTVRLQNRRRKRMHFHSWKRFAVALPQL
jgi:hypothetical protein